MRRAHALDPIRDAEGYFSQLKRSLDGTHHHVSREHPHRYVTEFDWRYSTRKLSDTARTARLLSQAHDKRLKYRETKQGSKKPPRDPKCLEVC